ncbi:hypothetical protein ACFLSJ_00880 [Verrucomicrobiota bacterium]
MSCPRDTLSRRLIALLICLRAACVTAQEPDSRASVPPLTNSVDRPAGEAAPVRSRGAGRTNLAERLARVGMPVLVRRDEAGSAGGTRDAASDAVHSLSVSTAWWNRLWRFGGRQGGRPEGTGPLPTVKSTIELNTATGVYEFRKVELGFHGNRLWITHEDLGDEGGGITGIHVMKEW